MHPFKNGRTLASALLGGVALVALAGVWTTLQGADRPAPNTEAASASSWAPTVLEGLQASSDTLSTLDGVFTEEQAASGKQVYDIECSLCHGPSEFAGRIFQLTWTGQPLSRLYQHISTAMPLDNPGGLDQEQYVAVLAYILELNGYPQGERTLPTTVEELGEIVMDPPPAPDSASAGETAPDDRPDLR